MQKLILLLGRQRREPTELRLPMLKALALLGRQIRSGKALGDEGLRALHLLELLRLVLIEAKPRALEPDPLASNRCER